MENLNGTVKVISAVVVGALAGAALGILFAPEKGYRTRRNLMNGAKDLADDLVQRIKDEASVLRSKADDLEELAKEKFEEMTSSAKQDIEEAVKAQK